MAKYNVLMATIFEANYQTLFFLLSVLTQSVATSVPPSVIELVQENNINSAILRAVVMLNNSQPTTTHLRLETVLL